MPTYTPTVRPHSVGLVMMYSDILSNRSLLMKLAVLVSGWMDPLTITTLLLVGHLVHDLGADNVVELAVEYAFDHPRRMSC